MFYLSMHSTHFIYRALAGMRNNCLLINLVRSLFYDAKCRRKERNVLLSSVHTQHILFMISSKGSFMCTIPQTG